jgi:hypothetical protein
MYNAYAAEHAYWSDTTNMDNLRGADSTGKATPGAMEVDSNPNSVTGFGNTRHSFSGDEIHVGKCSITFGTVSQWYAGDCSQSNPVWFWIGEDGVTRRRTKYPNTQWGDNGNNNIGGYVSLTSTCGTFNFKSNGDTGQVSGDGGLRDGTIVWDANNGSPTISVYNTQGGLQAKYITWCT